MDISKLKFRPDYASYLPVLIEAMKKSNGPVLEMGVGVFSTPVLHWLCLENKRELVSYENSQPYFQLCSKFQSPTHKINFVRDWAKADIEHTHWGVVLIDHDPAIRRIEDAKRVANNSDYIIIHDTDDGQNQHYRYDLIYPLFKYRYNYKRKRPYTTVLSNFKDFRE